MLSPRSQVLFILLLIIGLCGCSAQQASITGKVTADGKSVTGGTIVLSPLGDDGKPTKGNPGMADVGQDGSFSLQVEGTELAKKFSVRYSPPPVQVTAATAKKVATPYQGLVPKDATVDVKPGSNVVEIELVPRGK